MEMDEVRRARAFALSIADDAGLSERQAQNLHLVVEEAVANIVNYSGATMMQEDLATASEIQQYFLPRQFPPFPEINDRLDALLKGMPDKSSRQIIADVKAGVTDFVAGAEQHDDITMLVLKRK